MVKNKSFKLTAKIISLRDSLNHFKTLFGETDKVTFDTEVPSGTVSEDSEKNLGEKEKDNINKGGNNLLFNPIHKILLTNSIKQITRVVV